MKLVEPAPPTSSNFFTSIWMAQTWLNVIYLLFSFPLGLIYFIFLITGISLGLGLLITLFGIFILMGVLLLSQAFISLEVFLTEKFLGFYIPRKTGEAPTHGFWNRFRAMLRRSTTWTGLFYLLLRFPLGTFSFSLTIGLLSASLGLMALPIAYWFPWYTMDWPYNSRWAIDTFPETILWFFVGIFLLLVSLYVLNLLAWVYGKIAKTLMKTQ